MPRGRLFILIGLVVLLIAVVAIFLLGGIPGPVQPPVGEGTQQVVEQGPTAIPPTEVPLVEVIIALQTLPRGFRFPLTVAELEAQSPPAVTRSLWPDNPEYPEVLTFAISSYEELAGKIARTDIFRGQPILETMLVDNLNEIATIGSDLAAVLEPGQVAVALPMDRLTSVAYGIQDGDHVDVNISMLFVDVDEAFQSISPNTITLFSITEDGIAFSETFQGRPDVTSLGPAIIGPSERQRPRLVTQRAVQDALVVHVGDFPQDGRFLGVLPTPTPVPAEEEEGQAGTPPPPPTPIPRPNIITVAVSAQDAVVLTWAVEARLPITFSVRATNDTSRGNTTAVSLDYIMSTFRVDLPGKRTFTIEPAIRSIRQLLVGDEIGFETAPAAGG
jgi:Flp pilus assembly protein CpaB